MKLLAKTEDNNIANVYIASFGDNKTIEFVESVQPPYSRDEKWVLIVSTLFGCPVKCRFCDSGGSYNGRLTKEEIFSQIDYLIRIYFPDLYIPVSKFKIQFARMGEPAFNHSVIDVLKEFPVRYNAPGFIPSVSTIAPAGSESFFHKLLEVKKELYPASFQLQFSIHSTDSRQRDYLIPVKKWSFEEIGRYSERFFDNGGRKITLNFALAKDTIIEPQTLKQYFNPERFIIKVTPVNPTYTAEEYAIRSFDLTSEKYSRLCDNLKETGYDIITSIGEPEENMIGSNCGQYINNLNNSKDALSGAYTYKINRL